MKEHPILFSTEMVKAILEGRKTQTRRATEFKLVNDNPVINDYKGVIEKDPVQHEFVRISVGARIISLYEKCPYGQPGDRLWVRETFAPAIDDFAYKADYSADVLKEKRNKGLWKPSIHMPKAAARIWLEVEEVRVESLQDISEEDAKAEGVKLHKEGRHYLDYIAEAYNTTQFIYRFNSAKKSFKSLWELINERKKSFIDRQGIAWINNPWVWVIKFKVLSTSGRPETIKQQSV